MRYRTSWYDTFLQFYFCVEYAFEQWRSQNGRGVGAQAHRRPSSQRGFRRERRGGKKKIEGICLFNGHVHFPFTSLILFWWRIDLIEVWTAQRFQIIGLSPGCYVLFFCSASEHWRILLTVHPYVLDHFTYTKSQIHTTFIRLYLL